MTRKKGVPLTNFAASVKARLLERAHEDGEDFNSLPVRNAADDRKFSRLICFTSPASRAAADLGLLRGDLAPSVLPSRAGRRSCCPSS